MPLPDQEEELSLKYIEQLIAAVVNMARWPVPRGASRLKEPDSASCFLAGRFQRYGPCPDGLAFAWPENDTLWGVCPLISRIRLTHSLAFPLEVGPMYIILPFFSISLLWWSNPYSEAYYYPAHRIRRRCTPRTPESVNLSRKTAHNRFRLGV